MSVGEAKATIRRGIQSAANGRRIIETVAAGTAEASGLAAQILHNSKHAEVEKGLACLKAAAHELDLTVRRLEGCGEPAEEYLAALG
ncbi:hypothetical protein ABGB07_07925 [Micromonosporaceae bacterium B7E4]